MIILKVSETYDDWSDCSSWGISSHSDQSVREDMIKDDFVSDVKILINIWDAQEEGGDEVGGGFKEKEEVSRTSRIRSSSRKFRSLVSSGRTES